MEYEKATSKNADKTKNSKLTYKQKMIVGSGAATSIFIFTGGLFVAVAVLGYLTVIASSWRKYQETEKSKYIIGIIYGVLLGLVVHMLINYYSS